MREFIGIGGYTRTPEGAFSWQHLLFIGSLLFIMAVLAVFLGRKFRFRSDKEKNKALIWSAILIDFFELFKIVCMCIRDGGTGPILYELPLFLCSIQLITIPLAAFSKGRIKEASTDFVCLFGILGAVFGTVGAIQNYNAYPVLSLDNVTSGITHSISGFASLYIMIAGLASLKKKNIFITVSILLSFCVMAYVTNILIDYNYMFLMNHDGTPYSIVYNLVGGHPVLYPLSVVALFLIYIALFYFIVHLSSKKQSTAVLEAQERKELTV